MYILGAQIIIIHTVNTVIVTVMAAELVRAARSESEGEPERLR